MTFESAPAFLARIGTAEPLWLIDRLMPEGISVWHGRPRSMKSLCAMEAALALATGTPAFGRFPVNEPVDVLLLTEEDSERALAFRLRLMLAGRGIEPPPRLHLRSRAGWNLESAEDQRAMLCEAHDVPSARAAIIDPARGSLPSIDKGPADAAAAVRFLRRLMKETRIEALLLVHHDTKPGRDGREDRSRPERASGGVTFSIADAPVGFERVDDRSTLVCPSAFKHGADPQAFRVDFESATADGQSFRDYLRVVAVESSEALEQERRAEEAVLKALKAAEGWLGTKDVVKEAHIRRAAALAALSALVNDGRVSSSREGRNVRYRLPVP